MSRKAAGGRGRQASARTSTAVARLAGAALPGGLARRGIASEAVRSFHNAMAASFCLRLVPCWLETACAKQVLWWRTDADLSANWHGGVAGIAVQRFGGGSAGRRFAVSRAACKNIWRTASPRASVVKDIWFGSRLPPSIVSSRCGHLYSRLWAVGVPRRLLAAYWRSRGIRGVCISTLFFSPSIRSTCGRLWAAGGGMGAWHPA